MANKSIRNISLGLFILIGTILLIVSMYMVGSKQNLFGSNFKIRAQFYDVNGLMKGNNVRFAGIDIGTVESVTIINDSLVNVVMVIQKDIQPYIKKNSIASIGTDGLMGNKLVNIVGGKASSERVKDGDLIVSRQPLETDEMIRTLKTTNDNVKVITDDLKKITQKINSSTSLWSLLQDAEVTEGIKNAVVNIKMASNRSAILTGDLSSIVKDIKDGKGSVGALLMDTSFSHKVNQTIVTVNVVSDKLAVITGDLQSVSEKIKRGDGAVGTLLMDTTFVNDLNLSLKNIKEGSKGFSDNMEALKHSFLLRRYFKKQETIKK